MAIRKNFWRQSGEWATKLRHDPFVWPRLKFTVLNFLTIFLVFSATFPFVPRTLTTLLWLAAISALLSYFGASVMLYQIRNVLRAQKRFIADASHELRTPLSIIKADSELALLDQANFKNPSVADTLKSNLEEVDRMSKIIENLLALSFYDSKVTEIPFGPIDLADIAEKITAKAQTLAVKKGVTLAMEAPGSLWVTGNDTALEQMVMNLIRNALLYTPSGGTVSVSVKHDHDGYMVFMVRDTGIGISSKDLPHIFNPFYKAERPKTNEGSGLGLTIVRRIVDRHRGIIRIDSEIGTGTAVSVFIPELKNSPIQA